MLKNWGMDAIFVRDDVSIAAPLPTVTQGDNRNQTSGSRAYLIFLDQQAHT